MKQYLKSNSFINLLPVGYFHTPSPLSSSSYLTQQHHEDAALSENPSIFFPNTTKTQPLALRLSNHDLLPSH